MKNYLKKQLNILLEKNNNMKKNLKKVTLNKEFCKMCHNNQDFIFFHWCQYDENMWKQGIIECPNKYIEDGYNETPPRKCPYRLEHILFTQNLPE